MSEAERFMRLALALARRGVGRTSPNPAVGAVVVKGGRVVGRGFHRHAGAPHAEVEALSAAGRGAKGADLYTTLEPCDHYGRTPPCSLAILEAGVARVFSASADPNPLVRGRGIARLRRRGVQVTTGVLKAEADRLNGPFFKYMTEGLPHVTLKAAVTLDGRLAASSGDSHWVSGERSRAWVHQLRNRVDAVLVGANTARLDDPRLTTRLPGRRGRDAVRVVVDSRLRLDPRAKLFHLESEARTVVACTHAAPAARERRLIALGVEVWRVAADRRGRVALRALLERMARTSLLSVLVEGGAELFTSFIQQGLADELALFVAPKLVGAGGRPWLLELPVRSMAQAFPVGQLSVSRVGEDVLIEAPLLPGRRRKAR